MPELPEVETILNDFLSAHLIGTIIKNAEVFWSKTVGGSAQFIKRIQGQKFKKVSRRGKFLVFTLSQDTLFVHLRMTGKFFFGKPNDPVSSHERVRLFLDDGRILRYEDQRKFGRFFLTDKLEEVVGDLGLEPLNAEFSLNAFKKIIEEHPLLKLKSFLLNQNYIAGLGNIYVDEALWDAKLHPLRTLQSLSTQEIKALHHAIPKVLKLGIQNMGTTLGSHLANYYSVSGRRGNHQHQLKVFRRNGLACPRCGTTLSKSRISQRGTHFCAQCQIIQ